MRVTRNNFAPEFVDEPYGTSGLGGATSVNDRVLTLRAVDRDPGAFGVVKVRITPRIIYHVQSIH